MTSMIMLTKSLATVLGVIGLVALSIPSTTAAVPVCTEQAAAIKKIDVHDTPKAVPTDAFLDETGGDITLQTFKGKVAVVNFWATWCAPCITEMPGLDKVNQEMADEGVVVVPVSADRLNQNRIKAFIERQQWQTIQPYHDNRRQLVVNTELRGLPTTLILNRKGLEVARVEGDLHWDTPESMAYLSCLASS